MTAEEFENWYEFVGDDSLRAAAYDSLVTKEAEIKQLRDALEKSVELQSHYAMVLNMYDDGERIEFKSAQEWIDRLKVVKETESETKKDKYNAEP